jgi:hypothetical protein
MPLAFPGSNRKKSDGSIDPCELPFRDGRRTVVPYLADLMSGLDTARYTYEAAVDEVNNRMARDHANASLDRVITNHFRESN